MLGDMGVVVFLNYMRLAELRCAMDGHRYC